MEDKTSFSAWGNELNFLEGLYVKTKTEPQFLVLSGRRRLGKTYVLKKFIQGKPFIYYLATPGSIKDQLKYAGSIVINHFQDQAVKADSILTWGDLLQYIALKAKEKKERLVLVFDELSNLTGSEKSISLDFQEAWEKYLKQANIFLIVVGTNAYMSNKNALGYSSLLYSKKTADLFLNSFNFLQSKPLFNSDDFEKCFSLYALVGGIPEYIKKLDVKKSIKENIKENILSKDSFLSMEPQLLLSEEFSEPRKYFTILEAIGLGWVKYGDIIERTGFANNVLSKYLNTLINNQLVKRNVPAGENPQKSKKGTYFISDNFLRFYFNFILPNLSHIELGEIDFVFEKNKEKLHVLISRAYEVFAKEIISAQTIANKLPEFSPMDRWWEKNIKLDIVGLNKKLNSIIFVKSTWSDEPAGIDVLSDLRIKAKQVKWGRRGRVEYYMLLSKAGFTKELIKLAAQEENIFLVHGDEVLELKK